MKLFLKILIPALILSSCQFRVPKDPGIIVSHLAADPGTLNPIILTDSYGFEVNGFIYETLIQLDNETFEYKPLLASSWSVSSDHLQFTFYLRKDVRWHDGVPFTAGDIIYSYNMIQDPNVDAAVFRTSYRDVTKVEALDDFTVRFTYKKPYFRALLVCGGIPIVPRHVFDNGGDFNSHPAGRTPTGTRPFMFKDLKTKEKIVLERNPRYWGTPPKLKGIVFRIIEDQIVPFQELKKGEIDIAEIRSIQWERGINSQKFKGQFNRAKYYLPSFSYIAWNMRRPFFSDRRVRHAMSMLIDKEKIAQKLLFGHVVLVEGEQYIFGNAYDKSIKPDPYNPAAAEKLLEEAGWIDHDNDGMRDKDGLAFKFDFYYAAGSAFASRLASMMREDLLKLGIEMELRGLEFNALSRLLEERQFDAITLAWSVPLENDPYQLWHSSQVDKGSNHVGFSNEEADRLIEKIRIEFNKEARNELFKKLQKVLHDEQPYTYLFNPASLVVYHKRFTDVKVYKLGIDIKEWGVDNNL